MNGNKKKVLYLFLALLLPVFVFLFLKFFGKNEFAVRPLFQDATPEVQAGCHPIKIPYHISDSVLNRLHFDNDSLVLIWFGKLGQEEEIQVRRIYSEFKDDPVKQVFMTADDSNTDNVRTCVFLLKNPYDVVLIDRKGLIRGQFVSDNREEIDRLMTEMDIILKKY